MIAIQIVYLSLWNNVKSLSIREISDNNYRGPSGISIKWELQTYFTKSSFYRTIIE